MEEARLQSAACALWSARRLAWQECSIRPSHFCSPATGTFSFKPLDAPITRRLIHAERLMVSLSVQAVDYLDGLDWQIELHKPTGPGIGHVSHDSFSFNSSYAEERQGCPACRHRSP